MSISYTSVGWNPQKKWYDLTMLAGILAYLAVFMILSFVLHPNITAETAMIRGFGTGALVLLHVILAIGPLCRLDTRFLPLLFNRRHMGVTMFVLGLAHAVLATIQFHGFSDMNPLVSIFVSNADYGSLGGFPFQPLGFFALVILFAMAATSHDFWLANLSAPVWKALHMGVYLAYALLIGHVALGVMQAETSPLIAALVIAGCLSIILLHLIAGFRESATDKALAPTDGMVALCSVNEIKENRARIFTVAEERIAVFKYDGKISAVSNVCKHQNGPLGEGKVVDGCITCPWHGYTYQPNDGASPPPFKEKIPTFNVHLEGNRIWVDPKPNPPGTSTEPAVIANAQPAKVDDDPFYVGYFPKGPTSIMARTRLFFIAAIGLSVLTAVIFVVAMQPFPAAVFEFGTVREVEGYLRTTPYPHLLVERPGEEGTWSPYYLVNQGKYGANEATASFANQWVSLKGTLIYRDDQTMVELLPDGITALTNPKPAPDTQIHQGESVTIQGEIVDSKCFLGVMNPGDLKVHKACAIRCIEGGIPPILVQRLTNGDTRYYLLTGPNGQSINKEVIPFVAEAVEIKGTLRKSGDLIILETAPAMIQRI